MYVVFGILWFKILKIVHNLISKYTVTPQKNEWTIQLMFPVYLQTIETNKLCF